MPHIILNMNQCLDAMRGNATTGRLVDLRTAMNALDLVVGSSENPPEGSHELLEEIQTFLCGGGGEAGASNQAKTFAEACNEYLT